MKTNEKSINVIDGKKVIMPELLEKMLDDRDKSIERIRVVTDAMKKLSLAKTREEQLAIPIPTEFEIYGELSWHAMQPYVSGFTMADDSNLPRCSYGCMGSLASVLFPDLYRGEMKDYGSTSGISSLGRHILINKQNHNLEDKFLSFFVGIMRQVIFGEFLTHFRQFCEFPYGVPISGLIAQHYGLRTSFIDLTDDIKVALFFACCKRENGNEYRPISNADLSELGDNGVIYHGHSTQSQMIGYQPFYRCHRQRGYYIDTAIEYPCWEVSLNGNGFEKLYFKRTVELSERLCDEFDGGKTLFPDDNYRPLVEMIDVIEKEKVFPWAAFNIAYKTFSAYVERYQGNGSICPDLADCMKDKDYLVAQLHARNYKFNDRFLAKVDHTIVNTMNDQWDPIDFARKEGLVYQPFEIIEIQ